MIHTKQIFTLMLWVATLWLLVACDSREGVATVVAERPFSTPTLLPTHTPSPLPTATPSHTPTITPSHTPTHTPTATPTTTPFPTVTAPPVIATKAVFLQFWLTGGDGGHPAYSYNPNLVIYTDGQVILQERSPQTNRGYFVETTISNTEMCSLLSQLENNNFFDAPVEIYAFDETTQYSDGAPYFMIQVNGPITQEIGIYSRYTDYLIEPIDVSYNLVSAFHPQTNSLYLPERLLVWIQKVDPLDVGDQIIEPWPTSLPSIAEFWQDQTNPKLVIQGEFITPLMTLFDYQINRKLFEDGGVIYDIILRPLLPHEIPYDFPGGYYEPQSFELPFDCPNMVLPPVPPTITPSPTPTLDPSASILAGNGRILFTSEQDGNAEIYVINADGTNLTRLTNHWAKDEFPSWSPDSQQIVFISDRDGNPEVYTMNADGTDVTRLTYNNAIEESPAWSPNGTEIVFSRISHITFNFVESLHIINWDGTNETELKNSLKAVGFPAWSPDGTKIAFTVGKYDDSSIYVMNKDGTNQIRLTQGSRPKWSPDGQKIAFERDWQIYMMNADGSNVLHFPLTGNSHYMDWSSDGTYLVFDGYYEGVGSEIYVIKADGTNLIRLTANSTDDNSPDWSP